MKREWILRTVCAGMVATGLAACAPGQAEVEETPAAAQATIAIPATQTPAVIGDSSEQDATTETETQFELGIVGTGEVTARRTSDLSFNLSGTVQDVLVEEGDKVRNNQILATIDQRDVELQVAQAEASLAQAQANYAQLEEGATPEDVAAANAQIAQAQAQLRTTQGSVTDQDITAAQAQVEQANAALAQLQAGPKTPDVQVAQSQVDQAQANLAAQRDNLSAAKTNANLQIDQAANQLRNAQDQYSQIYWQNRELEDQLGNFGKELPQENVDQETSALRAVDSAEQQVEQSQLEYERAQQAEINGIAAAQAQVETAQANFDKLFNTVDPDQIAAARAQVAQAQANLQKLQGDQRAGNIQAAQAGINSAQANLQKTLAGPTQATLAGALAQIQNAEAALKQAQLNLDKTSLRAPFAGTVSIVNIDPGDLAAAGGQAAIQIVDVSELRVEVNISDSDISRVSDGQAAEVRVDAIPNKVFTGKVSYIAPTTTVSGNVRTYLVRIALDDQEALRSGMSVRVTILTE